MDSSDSSASCFGYKLIRTDFVSQLQADLDAANAQIEQMRCHNAENVQKFDEEKDAHAATKRELDAVTDTKNRQHREYQTIFESLDNQASEYRATIAEQASTIKELQAMIGPKPFHWLEPPSIEERYEKSREQVQELAVRLRKTVVSRDNMHGITRKLETKVEDANVKLNKANTYISKMKKRFHIGPRTSKEIEDDQDAAEKIKAQTLEINILRATKGLKTPKTNALRKSASPRSPLLGSKVTRVTKTSRNTASKWLVVHEKFQVFRDLKGACDRKVDERDATIGQLQADVDRQDADIKETRSQASSLRAVEREHSNCKNDLDAQISRNSAHETTITGLRSTVDDLTKQVEAHNERQTERDNTVSGLERDTQELRRSLEGAQTKTSDLEKDVQELRTSLGEAQRKTSDLEKEIQELQTSLDGSQSKLDEAKDKASELDKVQKDLQDKEKVLKDLQDVHLRCSQKPAAEATDDDPACTASSNTDHSERMEVDSTQQSVNVKALVDCKDHEYQIAELTNRCEVLTRSISDLQAAAQEVIMEDAQDSVEEVRRNAENEKRLLRSQIVNEQCEHSLTQGKLRRKERELSDWQNQRSETGTHPEHETEKSKRLEKQERDLVIRTGKIKEQEEQLARREVGLPPVLLDHRMAGQPQSAADALHEVEQQQMRKRVNDAEKNFRTLRSRYDKEVQARQDDAVKHQNETERKNNSHRDACRGLNDRIRDLDRRLNQAARDQRAEIEKMKQEMLDARLPELQTVPEGLRGQPGDAAVDERGATEANVVAANEAAAEEGSGAGEAPTAAEAPSNSSKRKIASDEDEQVGASMDGQAYKRWKPDHGSASTAPPA